MHFFQSICNRELDQVITFFFDKETATKRIALWEYKWKLEGKKNR
jgi:hypothetical protein